MKTMPDNNGTKNGIRTGPTAMMGKNVHGRWKPVRKNGVQPDCGPGVFRSGNVVAIFSACFSASHGTGLRQTLQNREGCQLGQTKNWLKRYKTGMLANLAMFANEFHLTS